MVFRDEAKLLPAFAKPDALDAAAAERGDGLVSLHAFVEPRLLRMQPGIDALRADGVLGHEGSDADEPRDERRQHVAPAESGDEQHHSTHGGEQQRRAHIGFLEDEQENGADANARDEHAASEGSHVALESFAIPGDGDDERELRELGGLHAKAAGADPAARTILHDADVRHPDQGEEHDHQQQERPPEFLNPAIVAGCGGEERGEADAGPNGLHDQVAGFLLAGAGADEHDDAKREQAEHGKEQKGCGGFHGDGTVKREA